MGVVLHRDMKSLWAAVCSVAVLGAVGRAAERAVPPVLPVENFAWRDVTSGLALSRDGRTIAYAAGRDRDWLLMLRDWETAKTETFGAGAGPATPVWTSAERVLYGSGASMDRDGRNLEQGEIGPGRVIASRIEGDRAGDVLVLRYDPLIRGRGQFSYAPAFPHVDRLVLRRGIALPEARNPGEVTGWLADGAGGVRVANDTRGVENRVLWRDTDAESWRVLPGLDFTRDEVVPLWLSADAATLGLAKRTPAGTWGLYSYDPKLGRIGELLLSHDSFDLHGNTALVLSPRTKELLGVYFNTERPQAFWFDTQMRAVQHALDEALPGRLNQVVSLGDDLKRMIVLSRTASDPGAYYQFDLGAKALKPVLARRPWIRAEQMADVFPASFKARDGQLIRGYLTLPAGRGQRGLPLVVLAYDGPGRRVLYDYDTEAQFLANRGYAVLAVNYRGSSGYGRKFQDQPKRNLGVLPQEDLADAVRWAVAQGIADPARVAIMGWGFGGTCALLGLSREPGLYRCAISMDGTTDWVATLAYRRQSDTGAIASLLDTVGEPGRDAAALREASPLHQADRLTAPVLLVIGNGYRVLPEENTAYVAALKRAGKPHEVLSKQNDIEGFNDTKGRVELLTRIERFLAANMTAK